MRHWLTVSTAAAAAVADRPRLWLPGALAWIVTVGWLPFVIGVGRGPSVAGLTFFGARLFTSGAWPWNGVTIGLALLAVALLGFVLAATGEAALIRGVRARPADMWRIAAIGLVCVVPVLVGIVALGGAAFVVAPAEFNAPGEKADPLLRTALRLGPLIVATVVASVAGAALHAAAIRHVAAGATIPEALGGGARSLRIAGSAAVAQASVLLLARLAFLVLAAVLLRVLWAPIGQRLGTAGIDPAAALLLVGFVAIWLCLILGGGALHAWGSVSWTGLLGTPVAGDGRSRESMETSTR